MAVKFLKPYSALLALGVCGILSFSHGAYAWDYDLRGYLGYALVSSDEDLECSNRACQGVLDDSLFYGLSASVQGEHLGAQVIVSQDLEEDPDISLAQATLRQQISSLDLNVRAGKIIVPLGLYGSQRITPTTQPGLVFPQSFLLNAYYDLLTLSDNGVGFDLRGVSWGLKAAVYEPEEEAVKRVVVIPATNGPLDFLLGGLLGLDALLGLGGTPAQNMTVVENQRNKAGYLGVDYRSAQYHADIGWIRQELGDLEIDAFNAGIQTTIGNFQPSIETFKYEVDDFNTEFEGISVNLLYSGERWQAFVNGVSIDIGNSDSTEAVLGAVSYWGDDGQLSTRVTWHRLDGNFGGLPDDERIDAYGLAIGYNWD